jgi:hypothetical protein
MIRRTGLVAVAALLVAGASPVSAQLEDNLSAYSDPEGYLKPLQEAFGQALCSNLYSTAAIPKQGFTARLEVKAMSVFFGDGDKTFTTTTGGDFTPVQTVEVPTVVGSEKSVAVSGDGGTEYVFPGGFDLTSLTVGVPQLTVGGIMGSELAVRYVAFDTGDAEIGDVSLFGIGARHSISQYLVEFPVDIAAGIFYQTFKLGSDLIDAKAFTIGAQASRTFGPLIAYGGLSYDSFSMDAKYTDKTGPQDEEVDLSLDTEHTLHLNAGAALSLGGIVHLNLGADIAGMTGVNAGFGFGF